MTIKDIARESGYSVGTVSRVLNNSSDVSDKARKRIMEVVEKYNFQLNNNAKHLKKQSAAGIAILIKGAQNMLFAPIVEQMQGLIRKNNYECLIYYLDEGDNEIEQAIQICRERNPLGIMFFGNNPEFFYKRFAEIKVPCIIVTNSASEFGFDNLSSVSTDDEEAAKFAVEHLISLGHKEIGILGGEMSISQTAFLRYKGCERAFFEHGMTFEPEKQYIPGYFTISDGYHAMDTLLKRMPEVTAVFAISDVMAIGAIRAIKDRGLRVPEDISVIGFDGIDIGKYTVPRLTTIRQHREEMATRGVEILLNSLNEEVSAIHEIEPFYLVPGESVRKLQ